MFDFDEVDEEQLYGILVGHLLAKSRGEEIDEEEMQFAAQAVLILNLCRGGAPIEETISKFENEEHTLKFALDPVEGLSIKAVFNDDPDADGVDVTITLGGDENE